MANIPNDIISEILSKLPVYSLLRFRWACKYWFDLITRDHDFIKMHLLHSTSDIDQIISRTSVLISGDKVFYSSKYKDMFDTSLSSPLKPAFMVCKNPFGHDFETLGSCNGLMYLRTTIDHNFSYFLWNPSTTEFKELPHYDKLIPKERKLYRKCSTTHGFGYDHTIDDYKVIKIENFCIFYDDNVSSSTSIINIYTLGSNSWSTKIETKPILKTDMYMLDRTGFETSGTKSGVLVNGALHWVMLSGLRLSGILCFDIAKEEHREIQLPEITSAMWNDNLLMHTTLQVLNGCLCIFLVDIYYGNVELWMMKEYGTANANESWTKLLTIDVKSLLVNEISLGKGGTLIFWFELLKYYSEDGGILLLCELSYQDNEKDYKKDLKYLLTYYPKNDKATIKNTRMESGNAETCYIESLVSVKSGKYLSTAAEGPS